MLAVVYIMVGFIELLGTLSRKYLSFCTDLFPSWLLFFDFGGSNFENWSKFDFEKND